MLDDDTPFFIRVRERNRFLLLDKNESAVIVCSVSRPIRLISAPVYQSAGLTGLSVAVSRSITFKIVVDVEQLVAESRL